MSAAADSVLWAVEKFVHRLANVRYDLEKEHGPCISAIAGHASRADRVVRRWEENVKRIGAEFVPLPPDLARLVLRTSVLSQLVRQGVEEVLSSACPDKKAAREKINRAGYLARNIELMAHRIARDEGCTLSTDL